MRVGLVEYLKIENSMLLKEFYKTIDVEHKKELLLKIKENLLYINKFEYEINYSCGYTK